MNGNLIGQILEKQFRVESFIASGGSGAVYKAWDLRRNVYLALKVLHTDLADDPAMFRRFKREARALQRLAHPNIVPFYGLHQTSDLAFLLEDYIDGPTLKQVLRSHRGRPLPVRETLSILKSLSAALGYAHANGVVHCDVKPGNVMFDSGGNVYLADFGIARHAESSTTTLAAAGTPAYMAPEQILGKPVTPATDVYALGIMCFEMLTGQRPFSASGGSEDSAAKRIRYAHLTEAPYDLLALNPALPPALAQVIMKALAKEPQQRYPDAPRFFAAACQALGISPSQLQDRLTAIVAPFTPERPDKDSISAGDFSSTYIPRQVPNRRLILPLILSIAAFMVVTVIYLGLHYFSHPIAVPTQPAQSVNATVKPNHITGPPIETNTLDTPPSQIEVGPTSMATQPIRFSSPAAPLPTTTSVSIAYGTDGMPMVYIPAGEFLMGMSENNVGQLRNLCPDCDFNQLTDAQPQHTVYLDGFWIDQWEVTNAQFLQFVNATGYQTTAELKKTGYTYAASQDDFNTVAGADWRHPTGPSSSIAGEDRFPVVQVSWDDATAYCQWAGRRLPTEAEWEKAARSGDGRLFPWGNTPPNGQLLNFDLHTNGPMVVGSFPNGASPYGALDMAGNVWEWTADYYGETFYQNSPGQNPTGPATGEGRVFRGGSWASASKKWMMLVSTFYRLWNYPTNRSDVIGFRCATNNQQLGGGSINHVTTPEASQFPGQATAEPGFYNFYACGNPCNGNPTLALQQFPKKTKFIYLNWTYENVPAGAHYDRVWSVDGREWVRYDCSWNGPSNGQESDLKLWDMQGLTSGTWTLSIFIDGRNVLQESLEVLGNWNIWTPAGTFNTCYGSR